jgi:hypothetical protein
LNVKWIYKQGLFLDKTKVIIISGQDDHNEIQSDFNGHPKQNNKDLNPVGVVNLFRLLQGAFYSLILKRDLIN